MSKSSLSEMRFEKSHFEKVEVRIFFENLTSEVRKNILISKSHLPRSEKIITKEILFWTSLSRSFRIKACQYVKIQ